MKKIKKSNKKWLVIHAEDYLKKGKIRENTRNRYHNVSDKDRQKLREYKKDQVRGMCQKELQQRVEQLIQHMKELLKKVEKLRVLAHYIRIYFEAKPRHTGKNSQ